MKALVLNSPGTPENLTLAELPKPSAKEGHALIEVRAVGLNPVDYKTAARGNDAWSWPHILGLDVAGVIVDLDSESNGLKIGDRVCYHGNLARPGGYAEYATAPQHILAPIPDEVTFEDAAAIPCAGFTAWQILSRKIRPVKGQTILAHGGAGGVGGFAIQLAKYLGLTVITTCSGGNFDAVRALGADYPVDYKKGAVTSKIREITDGRGVDIAINTISSESATDDLDRLAFGGHLACVDGLPDFSKIVPFTKAISIHESALGGAHLSGDVQAQKDLAAMGREVMGLLKQKCITSMLAEVISMPEIPTALTKLSHRHVQGKIVAAICR
jgi:NADPH:quinone reductase-like Zn-dependent oxidoreductase